MFEESCNPFLKYDLGEIFDYLKSLIISFLLAIMCLELLAWIHTSSSSGGVNWTHNGQILVQKHNPKCEYVCP